MVLFAISLSPRGVVFETYVEVSLLCGWPILFGGEVCIVWWDFVSEIGICWGVGNIIVGGLSTVVTPCFGSLALLVWGWQLGVISMFTPLVGDKVWFPRCECRPL